MLGVVDEVAHRNQNCAGATRDLRPLLGETDPCLAPLHQPHAELLLQLSAC